MRGTHGVWIGLVVTSAMLMGCSNGGLEMDSSLDAGIKKLFTPKRSPQQYMILAVSSEDPDVRRDAVTRVSDSKKYDEEWAIKGLRAIALLESDVQTRCVALRALGRTGDPRAVEAMLMILNHERYPAKEVWPPQSLCRWDATVALADMSARGQIPAEQRDDVRATLVRQLKNDHVRHARIAAARGLGYYQNTDALEALIDGLEDDDFAVVHQSEASLVQLTGYTFDCSVSAWEQWYAEHHDAPFAKAGYVPESRRPPYEGKWGKAWYETKEFIVWLWPGPDK